MKRIITVLTSLVLACTLSAQQYQMHITDAEGQTVPNQDELLFLEDGSVVIPSYVWDETTSHGYYTYDTIPAKDLRMVQFLSPGQRPWELNYAPEVLDVSRHDDYGYGSVMHIRDMMTEDMTARNTGYNWYRLALEADLGDNYYQTHVPWYFYVDAIMQCTELIQAIGSEPANETQKAILAEAFATRAMLYLDFARMYEFLPNERTSGITSRNTDVNGLTVPILEQDFTTLSGSFFAPRVTKAEIVDYISRDLGRAEQYASCIISDSHEIPHLDAIYGLRARLELWKGAYAEAAEYANKAINASTVRPMTREEMLSTTLGFNDISCWMWGVQQTWDKNIVNNLANFTSWLSPEYMEGYASLVPPMIGRSLYDRINDADPRKLLFVAPEGSVLSGQTPRVEGTGELEPYTAVKFRPAQGKTTWQDGAVWAAYPLMRIEEMYFICAEANAHLNPLLALNQLTDFIWTYRYNGYSFSPSNTEDLINEIILQKRIEFWGEGLSFFDFKRLNMSVTRDYEGSNFYASAAFNTMGRPWWMNLTLPRQAATTNLALYGYENPQENSAPLELMPGFQIQRPAFLHDFKAVPVDSVDYLLLHLVIPDTLKGASGTLEISLTPDFSLGKTALLTSFSDRNEELCTKLVQADIFCSRIKALTEQNGLPSTGEVTIYVRALVDNACSSTLTLPFQMSQTETKHADGFSYMPTLTASSVDPIDCEAMAGEDLVKVVNMGLKGDGSFYPMYSDGVVGHLTFGDKNLGESQLSFYINEEGQQDNTYDEFNYYSNYAYNEILQGSANAYTFDGILSCYVQRNDLMCLLKYDPVPLSLKFNQQQIAENKFNWDEYLTDYFTSGFQPERTGTVVTIEQATDDAKQYRIIAPYQRNHNLMFRVNNFGVITLHSQMAYFSDGIGRVFVQGSGNKVSENVFTFSLTFTTEEGRVLGTATEQIGREEVWESIGMGTYRDDLITAMFAVENVVYQVEIEQSNTGKIRLVNPYGAAYPYNEEGDYDPAVNYYLTFDISNPSHVMMEPDEADLGMEWSYGMFRVKHLQDQPGTLANGIITFPFNAFYMALTEYNDGQWTWYGNGNGMFAIALPGVEIPQPVDSWTRVGTGAYTYVAWDGDEAEPDPGYVLSKRDDSDVNYRIEDWFYGVNLAFVWDKTTNQCHVPEQYSGPTHPTYGEVYVCDGPTYHSQLADTPVCFDPETSTFKFYMVYYCEAGIFGRDVDTFEVTFDSDGNVKSIHKSDAPRTIKKTQDLKKPQWSLTKTPWNQKTPQWSRDLKPTPTRMR